MCMCVYVLPTFIIENRTQSLRFNFHIRATETYKMRFKD